MTPSPPVALVTETVSRWLRQPRPDTADFPYTAVTTAYRSVGKHHVDRSLLHALVAARSRLADVSGDQHLLRTVLDVLLDKHDGRYDYRTYLALPVLAIGHPGHPGRPAAVHDRLLVLLLTDLLRFELGARTGTAGPLPRLRPPAPAVAKRIRHALRAAEPALGRLHPGAVRDQGDPLSTADRVCAGITDGMTGAEHLTMRLSMLPVDTVHDEYLFIRVLQAFEATFAQLAAHLAAAATHLRHHAAHPATARLSDATRLLHESGPLWSVLATMQPEAFRTFRRHTEGASAIQSENYKLVEALCRRPDHDRLHSAAYRSTPSVIDAVLAGLPTVDDAYQAANASRRLTGAATGEIRRAMNDFAAALHRWRRTHHRLAVRMIGSSRLGTGYSAGTPYLAHGQHIEVFRTTAPVQPSARN